MKNKAMRDELRQLTAQQLVAKVDEFRRELLTIHLQKAATPHKSFSSTKRTLRRGIARGLTLLRQKSQE